ncbi:hypothetical protein DFH09DRAFT_1371718 [Mycena vulgaris]|nr:hypothetical protein DFH09DRAFT_1371718 [Mycena vulgaris]
MPKGSSKDDIIFTGFESQSNRPNLVDDFGESESDLDLNPSGDYQDPKICLNLLKTMIATVLDTESDAKLLTHAEISVLLAFEGLSVHAQHLFVYLVLHPTWHRLPSLQLVEIPRVDLSCAIAELVRPIERVMVKSESDCEAQIKPEPADPWITLEEATTSLSSGLVKKEEPFEDETFLRLESPLGATPSPSDADVKSFVNAIAGPSTLFPPRGLEPSPSSLCITDSEITLRQLLECMRPDEQRTIGKDLKIKTGQKKFDLIESILSFSSSQTTLEGFFSKGKAKAGTEKPNSQEARLRTMIMKTLQRLVRIHEDVYDILRRVHLLYFRSTHFPTEILPRPLRHRERKYPEYTCTRDIAIWPDRETLLEYEDVLMVEAAFDGLLPSASSDPKPTTQKNVKRKDRPIDEEVPVKDKKAEAVRKAKATKKLFDEAYSRWSDHLGLKSKDIPDMERPGLERLEPGYVLTRVLHKGVKAFKVLKKRRAELDVYEVLLEQPFWCRGLRGPWHIRRTRIHAGKIKDSPSEGKSAIEASKEGIIDPATGLGYRPALIKNLVQLQKRLQVPEEEQTTISEGTKVPKIVLEAMRMEDEKNKSSLWRTTDGEVLEIDKFVSQHYGFDFGSVTAGGYVFTTLFTLIFWDIIFMPVVGAFETHFQTCPLDLCDDTFVTSRMDAIASRLSEIEGGNAVHYLEKHDGQYREAAPRAVGVRWDLCSRKELISIVKLIPPKTLANICQMFCEDYTAACIGAPDLIAWDRTDYKLVHIKGPGYPSRQSQKAWQDVLARGCANQEVCEVVEPGKKKKGKKKKSANSDSESASGDDEPESEEEDYGRAQSQAASKKRTRDSGEEDEYQPKNSKRRKTSK